MRIAFVTLYGLGAHGGTTKVLCDLANGLRLRGHDVGVFYFERREPKIPYPLNADILRFNCCQTARDKVFGAEFLSKLRGVFAWGRKNRRIARNDFEAKYKGNAISRRLKNFNPDVVISFSQLTTYMLLAKMKVNVPVVTMLHSNPQSYFDRPEFSVFKQYLEQSAAIQVLMPEFVDVVNGYLNAQKVSYIPNIVPQYDEIAELISPRIINVARVMSVKRQHLLIEAFALISEKYPDWNVEIWGQINKRYETQLQTLILKYNLQERVFLKGPSGQIEDKLNKSSIFVFPSQKEGFAIALCEAMSMGLPVVGCKSCSAVNSLIIDGKNGFLCEDSAESISIAIDKLIVDCKLRKRLGLQARADMAKFSNESVITQWEQLLSQVRK